jgi:hypothetical protein
MFTNFLKTIVLDASYAVTRDRLAAEGLTLTPLQFLRMPLNRRISMATLACAQGVKHNDAKTQ